MEAPLHNNSSGAGQQIDLLNLEQPPRYSEQPPELQSPVCNQQLQLQVNLQHPDYLKPVTPPSYVEATSQERATLPPFYPLWRPTADILSQGLVYPCGDHSPAEICVYCATPSAQRRVFLRQNVSSNSWRSDEGWHPTWLKIVWFIFIFAFISTSLSFIGAFVYADLLPTNDLN